MAVGREHRRASRRSTAPSTGCSRSSIRTAGGRALLETNVTIDAEDLLLREFLGVRTTSDTAATAAWIRSKQRDDGTWANFYGGPADLSTTVEAYAALRLAGDPADAEHMRSAREFVLAHGRRRAHAGLHEDLARALRAVAVVALPVIPPS